MEMDDQQQRDLVRQLAAAVADFVEVSGDLVELVQREEEAEGGGDARAPSPQAHTARAA